MDVKIQLFCMLISFLYGMFIKLLIMFNNNINKSSNIILHTIIDLLQVYIIVILYINIIYKMNTGIFHIYFLLLMLLGYILMSKYVKFLQIRVNIIKKKLNK